MKIRFSFFLISFVFIFGIFAAFCIKFVPDYNLTVSEQKVVKNHQNFFSSEVKELQNTWYVGIDKSKVTLSDSLICARFFANNTSYQECLDADDEDQTGEYYTFPITTEPTNSISFVLENTLDINEVTLYSLNTLSDGKKLVFSLPSLSADAGVISRARWGADETLRYVDHPRQIEAYKKNLEYLARPKTEEELKTIAYNESVNNFLKNRLGNEFTTTSLIRTENGHRLALRIQKVKKVNKIIVHHTADKIKGDKTDEEIIRGIYAYHAVTRGWGDIGYNYIVGQTGKIYEGRAGGDYVVGAHAQNNNIGSVGISVLGDYQADRFDSIKEQGLKNAISMVARKYGITLSKTVEGYKKCQSATCYPLYAVKTPALLGHGDVGVTNCPGRNIHRNLSAYIRDLDRTYTPILNTEYGIIEPKPANEILNKEKRVSSDTPQSDLFSAPVNTPKNSLTPTLTPQPYISANILPISPSISLTNTSGNRVNIIYEKKENGQNNTINTIQNNISTGALISEKNVLNNFEKYNIISESLKKILSETRYFGEKFRVKLSYPYNTITLSSFENLDGTAFIDYKRKNIENFSKISISPTGKSSLLIQIGNEQITAENFSFSAPVVQIDSWQRKPEWDDKNRYNDNIFRDTIEVFNDNGKLIVVNHLPLEYYLKGLGEVSNSDLPEKIKTITVAARGYAKFYMQRENRKYSTSRYDGNDDPESFQKYIGYAYELRSPNVSKMVDITAREVIYYNNILIKPWYFSVSDGKTLSFLEYCQKNSGKNCENISYLQSVSDPAGNGKIRSGHGVGISGIGATEFARQGWDYKKIIQYYLNGVEIKP